MTLERTKAFVKAIAELEIALNTFYYGDAENFERINKIYKELKEVKSNYFDWYSQTTKENENELYSWTNQ